MTTKAERREGVNTFIILAKWEMGKRVWEGPCGRWKVVQNWLRMQKVSPRHSPCQVLFPPAPSPRSVCSLRLDQPFPTRARWLRPGLGPLAFSSEAGQEGEENQGGRKKNLSIGLGGMGWERGIGTRDTRAAPSCLPVGEAMNRTQS